MIRDGGGKKKIEEARNEAEGRNSERGKWWKERLRWVDWGVGGDDKERSYCLPECSYPLFICEMKDKPLLYLQAWKQSGRLYYSSLETYTTCKEIVWEDSKWWGARGLMGIHVVGSRCTADDKLARWDVCVRHAGFSGFKTKWFTHNFTD